MNSKSHTDIMNTAKPQTDAINNFIASAFNNGQTSYRDLVTINAHNTRELTEEELKNGIEIILASCKNRHVPLEKSYFIQRKNDGSIAFIHDVSTNMSDDNIECRLYLNLEASSIIPFSQFFSEICDKEGVSHYYKFGTNDFRNDNFVIYTNYNTIHDHRKIIAKIFREHPELFINANKMNPFVATLDKYIGFGEHTKILHESFNSIRATAINNAVQMTKASVVKGAICTKGILITSENKQLGMDDYLVYFVTKNYASYLAEHNIDVNSKKVQETIKSSLKSIYSSIIDNQDIPLHLPSITGAIVDIQLDLQKLLNKLITIYKIKNENEMVRRADLLTKIYLEPLHKTIVNSKVGSMHLDEYLVTLYKNASISALQSINNQTFDDKIALSRLKSGSEAGRCATIKSLARYLNDLQFSELPPLATFNMGIDGFGTVALDEDILTKILEAYPGLKEEYLASKDKSKNIRKACLQLDINPEDMAFNSCVPKNVERCR